MVGGDGCTYVLHEMYFGGEVSSGGQRSEFARRPKNKNIQQAGFPDGHPL